MLTLALRTTLYTFFISSSALATPPAEDKTPLWTPVESSLRALEQAEQEISRMASIAHQQRDQLYSACLDHKLLLIRGYQQIAERSGQRLIDALAAQNIGLQRQVAQKILAAQKASPTVSAVRQQCGWLRGLRPNGQTIVELEVNPRLSSEPSW